MTPLASGWNPVHVLLAALGVFAVWQVVLLVRVGRAAGENHWLPRPLHGVIGFVTNFFDTLGIGNFAPTTAWFRFARVVPDERIPGTMNIGHTLPVITMAFFFIDAVEVEPRTLTAMIGGAIVGAWLGAGVVARLPRRKVQVGMGVALLIAVGFMLTKQFEVSAEGGVALGLQGGALVFAVAAIAGLAALMTIGVGLYAPCMILVSLLGMDPKASFPIMMGACAFLMPVASARFVAQRSFVSRPALGLTLGGIPAVILAATLVKSMPLQAVRWLVIVVVIYTGIAMLRAAVVEGSTATDRT